MILGNINGVFVIKLHTPTICTMHGQNLDLSIGSSIKNRRHTQKGTDTHAHKYAHTHTHTHTHFFFNSHFIYSTTVQSKRNGVEFKTGDAQHAVEHMAHQLVLTSTTKVYDSYNLQRLAMTLHVH